MFVQIKNLLLRFVQIHFRLEAYLMDTVSSIPLDFQLRPLQSPFCFFVFLNEIKIRQILACVCLYIVDIGSLKITHFVQMASNLEFAWLRIPSWPVQAHSHSLAVAHILVVHVLPTVWNPI
jgi:hypothetical protein